MSTITFISTIHKSHGRCDSHELFSILEEIKPEIIFLEALENTYSKYQQYIFENFGVYHEKLELAAIQKFSAKFPVKYVPVLENALPDSFGIKYNNLKKFPELQMLVDENRSNVEEMGFAFLNSQECSDQHEKMRERERHLLNDTELEKLFNKDIDTYENSMMRSIYSYCRHNEFDRAVFMCGVAHRSSIINKMEVFNMKEKFSLNWKIYGS